MIPTPTAYRPSRGDRIAIVIFMITGVAIVAWSGIAATIRIVSVLSGKPFQVQTSLFGVAADAPLGPKGTAVSVDLDSVILTVSKLSPAGTTAAVLEQVLFFVTVTTFVVCLLLLARNTLGGRIFGRGNTVLISTAGLTALIGSAAVSISRTMSANDALASASGGGADGFSATISPLPYVLGAFVFAIVATAYTIGARLQRETEGLV